MNAQPDLQQTAPAIFRIHAPADPGLVRIFVTGSHQDLWVPMREIVHTRPRTLFRGEEDPPVTAYDTSCWHTCPQARIELAAGLDAVGARCIEEHVDDEQLPVLHAVATDHPHRAGL